MKISKERLKEIIREELEKVDEGTFGATLARHTTAQKKLASVKHAESKALELLALWKAEKDPEKKKEISNHIQAIADAAASISESPEELVP